MDSILTHKFLVGFICGSIFLLLVFIVLKINKYLALEARIKPYILENKKSKRRSLSDKTIEFFEKILKKYSGFVSKSEVLKKEAKRYDKYLVYNNKNTINSLDLISIKIMFSGLIGVLYLITTYLKNAKIDFMMFLIVLFIGYYIFDLIIITVFKKKSSLMSEQLLEAVVIMNSAFKSGKNILQAIEIVKTEMPNPIKHEFTIIHKDLNCGLSVENAFERFYKRINLEETKLITSSLSLLSKTGGNIVSVFNMIEQNFYDRLKIKNELNALTSTSKMLYYILIFMPFIFISIIVLLNPGYFMPLINTKIGIIIDIIIITIYVLYLYIIKRVMKVEEV